MGHMTGRTQIREHQSCLIHFPVGETIVIQILSSLYVKFYSEECNDFKSVKCLYILW